MRIILALILLTLLPLGTAQAELQLSIGALQLSVAGILLDVEGRIASIDQMEF